MNRCFSLLTATLASAVLAACSTTPEPVVEEKVVEVIVPEPIDTCTPISALTRVVIPAETEVIYGITEIANPPYEPIQRREKIVREVTPEEVIYIDSEGKQVLDLCDTPQGVTPEQMNGFDDLGDAGLAPQKIGGPTTLIDRPIVDLDPNN